MAMISAALKFWPTASYASIGSDRGAFTNRPADVEAMRAAVTAARRDAAASHSAAGAIPVSDTEVEELAAAITAQRAAHALESQRQADIRAMHTAAYGTTHAQTQRSGGFAGKASQSASGKQLTQKQLHKIHKTMCANVMCKNNYARKCEAHMCQRHCPGPCRVHGKI